MMPRFGPRELPAGRSRGLALGGGRWRRLGLRHARRGNERRSRDVSGLLNGHRNPPARGWGGPRRRLAGADVAPDARLSLPVEWLAPRADTAEGHIGRVLALLVGSAGGPAPDDRPSRTPG